jgi:succinoglycan biosynthesis transport protein ExoP
MERTENRWNNPRGRLSSPGEPAAFPSYPNPAQGRPPADSGGAVLEYWQLIKRRKWWIFLTAILGALTAFVVLVVQQPIYESGTTVELQGFNESFMNLGAVDPLAGNYAINKENINTQIRIIQSSSIRRPVMDRLRRETAPVTPPKGGTLYPLRALIRGKEDPLGEMLNGLYMAAGSLKVAPVIGTRIINISCESTIPDIASAFVNAVVAEYTAQSAQQRTISSQKTSQWLESQLEETRQKVEQAEGRLQDFVRKSGATFVGGDKEPLASTKLKQHQGELAMLQA